MSPKESDHHSRRSKPRGALQDVQQCPVPGTSCVGVTRMMFPEHETRKRGQKNAFGKCVSQTAKAKAEKREDTAETNPPTPTARSGRGEVRAGLEELRPVREGRDG